MNSPGHFALSFPTVLVTSAVFGPLAFNQFPKWSDLVTAGLLYVGTYTVFPSPLCGNNGARVKYRNVPGEYGCTHIPSPYTNVEVNQTLHENDPLQPGVTEDFLFLVAQSMLHARADVVWSLDEQSRTYFRWCVLCFCKLETSSSAD